MSTTTTNLGLIKPEKTDSADITATNLNWDIIDAEINNRNIHSYTSLEQLGLSDSDMSTSDFKSNIIAIVTELNANNSAIISIPLNSNLTISAISQINADLGLNISFEHEGWIYIAPSAYDYRPYRVTVMLDRGIGDKALFSTIVNRNIGNDWVQPFVVEHDPKGFVSKAGDKMFGSLIINAYNTDYQSSLNDYNGSTELRSEKTDGSSDYDSLIMYNESHTTNLAHKFKYRVCKSGTSKDYAIYGEHNKPYGTYTGTGVSRAIPIGGIGKALFIWSDQAICFVTNIGWAGITGQGANSCGTGSGVSNTAYFSSDGQLHCVISDSANANVKFFNKYGTTYYYQVL